MNVLPDWEFNRLLRAAILGLQEEHKPLLFAVLLFLATPLSLEEICALNYGDFQTLHEYTDCLTVHISKTYERQEGHKNYQLRKIQDYYKQRIFPLSTIIKLGFDSLTPGSPDALLIHNLREPHRHYRPDHLLQYIRRECSAIIKTPQYKNKTPQQFLSLIKKTVENNYTTCGIEDDEFAYLFGCRPASTAGISYHDFGGEGELLRLSLLQDRWLTRYIRNIPSKEENYSPLYFFDSPPAEHTLDAKNPLLLYSSPGNTFTATIELTIEPLDEENSSDDPFYILEEAFAFRLTSRKGLSANISWDHKLNRGLYKDE